MENDLNTPVQEEPQVSVSLTSEPVEGSPEWVVMVLNRLDEKMDRIIKRFM